MSPLARDEFVATFIAAPKAELTLHFLKEKTRGLEKARFAWLDPGKVVDVFCESLSIDEVYKALAKSPSENEEEAYDLLVVKVKDRHKKCLIADMESTIIEEEMLDQLAAMIGAGEKVAAITKRAMNGDIDFVGALRERVILLKGQPEDMLTMAARKITFMAGAKELVLTMKANGGRAWLVSGGFLCFIKPIAEKLGFDRFYGNDLMIEDGKITGELRDPILDKNSKKHYLEAACKELALSLTETLSVGDGANDIPMLETCHRGGGLGVAYHAKPKVRALIPQQINQSDLTALLFAQGYKRSAFISSSRK